MKKLLLNAIILFVFTALSGFQALAQGTYLMCSAPATVTDSTGNLYDSGGLTGGYLINEDCTLLISPSCAASITISFQDFRTEPNYDFLRIYDGTTVTSTNQLMDTSGTLTLNPVTALSGSMLIIFHSDFTIPDSGFACTWTSVINPSVAPTAAFSVNNANPPLGVPVLFSNQSVGSTTGWFWDFGDGDTAKSQNPTHTYSASGNYTVSFIAYQCNQLDTAPSQSIAVQGAPQILVTPAGGFSDTVACGDSSTFNMLVKNVAGGQLIYNTDGSSSVGAVQVLAMQYGTDQFAEFPRTIAAINLYFTNYVLTTTGTINPGTLNGLLVGKNVLLIPEQETGSPAIWSSLAPVIQQFVNNGGSVIFCGSVSSNADCMFNTGLFTGSFVSNDENLTLDVTDPNDSLTFGLPVATFTAPRATYSMNITNPDKHTVVTQQGNDVVTWRYHGSGKVIFIAFDYFNINTNANTNTCSAMIIANAVRWGGQNALPKWIHLSSSGDTLNAGATDTVGVTFVASGVPAGTYYANIGVASNDPNNPLVLVPCTLTVTGFPIIALSETCLDTIFVMQHTTVLDTFTIINNGCDTLKITSITSTNPAFQVNGNLLSYLLPGAYADVIVLFNDTAIGTTSGFIIVENNDVDDSVCVTAVTYPAPKVTPSVSSISQNIKACSDTGTTTLDISNSGGSDLIFTIGSLPPWITASLTADTLEPDSSITIILNYGSGTFAGGPQIANILISSNDPLTPNKIVQFTMNVDFNPCMSYTVQSNTCTGFSTFITSSINTPNYYHWDFGDGDTSNVANPSHSYATNGTYTVVLVACNGSTPCDTVTQSVQAIITGPKPSTCYPVTLAYCCGIGFTNFKISGLWGNLIDNTTPDAVDGYQDYTCTDTASLETNFPYGVSASTGFTYVETFKMWLDLNNDGAFDTTSEQLYVDSAVLTNHAGVFVIPDLPTNAYNVPLRLRIASDYSGNPTPEPCLDLQFGQVEDYSVFLSFYDGTNDFERETRFGVYPNPFNQSTNIEYNLKNSADVSVEVFNIIGEKVNSFASTEFQGAGKHSYQFGNQSSGVYFVKLTVDGKSSTKKIVKM